MKKRVLAAILFSLLTAGIAHSFETEAITIHGFASTGYLKSDHNNFLTSTEKGSFEFNEFGLNFSTSLTDDIRLGMQLYSFDLGDIGNNDVKLDWAFLDYQWKEVLGIRLGKIKMSYGLYNETRDYDMLRTSILLPQSVYYKYLRDTVISVQGTSIYGKVSLGGAGRWDYDAFLGTANVDKDGGVAKFLARNDDAFLSGKMNYSGGIRVKWKMPVEGLLFGYTYFKFDLEYQTEREVENNDPLLQPTILLDVTIPEGEVIIFSGEYSVGNLTLAAEHLEFGADSEIEADGISGKQYRRNHPQGYYALMSYRFTNWLEGGSYYSAYYNDKNDHDGENFSTTSGLPEYYAWQKDLAVSTRFDINNWWLIKLEVHWMDGVGLAFGWDNPDGCDNRFWTLYAVKTTFNF